MAQQPRVAAYRDTRHVVSRNVQAARQKAVEALADEKSFAETFDTAADQMWLHRLYENSAFNQDFEPEEGWASTLEQKQDVIQTIDKGFHEYIFSSRSSAEFNFRVDHSRKTIEAEKALAQQGMTGVAAAVGAAMTDPVLVPTYFIPFVGAAGNAAKGLTVGGRVLKYAKMGALVTGAEGLAVSTAEYALRPNATYLDILYGTVASAGIGGTMGGIAGALTRVVDKEAIEETGAQLTKEGEEYFATVPTREQMAAAQLEADEVFDDVEVSGSVGAARTVDLNQATRADTEENMEVFENTPTITENVQDKFGAREFLSAVVLAGRSENGLVRELAMRLGQVSGNTTDDAPIKFAASTEKQMLEEIETTKFYEAKRLVDMEGMDDAEFNELVGRALRGDEEALAKFKNDSQRTFVESVRQQFADILEKAKKYGVEGLTDVPENSTYVPRQYDWQKLDAFARKYGWDKVDELFAGWINKANGDVFGELSERKLDLLRKAATGYRKVLQKKIKGVGFNQDHSIVVSKAEIDEMRAAMKAQADELGEEMDDMIDTVLDALAGARKEDGKPQNVHGRQRLNIDETSKVAMLKKGANPYGNPKDNPNDYEFVSLQDFLHNDIDYLMSMYVHRMSATMAMTKNGINTEESFATLLEKAKDMYDALPADKVPDRARQVNEIRALKYMYDSIMGIPADDTLTDGTKDFLRKVRDFNYVRMMGQAGLAATIEFSNVVMENGIRTMFKVLPAFKSLVVRAQDGKLDNQLMREITIGTGLGGDVLRSGVTSRLDAPTETTVINPRYDKADQLLAKGRKATSILGGLAPVTTFLSRLNAYGFSQSFADSFKKGEVPFSAIKRKQLGLSDRDVDGIKRMFDENAVYDGDRLVGLNTQNWTDQRALEKFMQAVRLDTTQNVQVTNIGSTNPWIRSEVGKTAFQFMSYTLGSNEQQFARQYARLQEGDKTPAKIFMGAMFMGTLTYIARVYLNSTGKDNQEQYIAERMEMKNLVRGVTSYYGALGIFTVPIGSMSPEKIIMNPTFQLAEAAAGLITAWEDGKMTDTELRNALRLLPLQNVVGINQGLNAIANEVGN